MLTLHIEADTYPELLKKAEEQLGGPLNLTVKDPVVMMHFPAGPKAPAPVQVPPAPLPDPVVTATLQAAGDPAAPTLPLPAPRRPGRPRKNTDSQAPAAASSGQAQASAPKAPEATAATAAPQVEVGNTTSGTPVAPPAASAPTAAPAPQVSAAQPVTAAGVIPTPDEVRGALAKVNGKLGLPKCSEVLKQFGAERISQVPEDKRRAFIAECERLAA